MSDQHARPEPRARVCPSSGKVVHRSERAAGRHLESLGNPPDGIAYRCRDLENGCGGWHVSTRDRPTLEKRIRDALGLRRRRTRGRTTA